MLHPLRSLVKNYWRIICFVILVLICIIETWFVIQPQFSESEINLNSSSCNYSKNIGRRIYFHKCVKENNIVYDIRYFFKEKKILKPDIIGVQLQKSEYEKLCQQCFS